MPRKAFNLSKYDLGKELTEDLLDVMAASAGGQAKLLIREAVEMLIASRLQNEDFRKRFEFHRKRRLNIQASGDKVTPIRPRPAKE